jgi:carboxymethylenebutenolidase
VASRTSPKKNVLTEDVGLAGYGGDLVQGMLARPATEGRRAGVLVLGDAFGFSDHFRDVARRFAAAGYNGLALDLFSRTGPPDARPVPEDLPKVAAFLDRLPDVQVLGDIEAAVAWLRARDDASPSVGCIGFCLGGLYTQLAMASPDGPDAGVDLYGRLRHHQLSRGKPEHPLDVAARTRAPLMALFGARDPLVPRGHIESLRRALEKTGQPHVVHIYEEVGHAFFHDGRPESYHPAAAADAWQRTLDWFARHLAPPAPPVV